METGPEFQDEVEIRAKSLPFLVRSEHIISMLNTSYHITQGFQSRVFKRKIYVHTRTHIWMFIAALFVLA